MSTKRRNRPNLLTCTAVAIASVLTATACGGGTMLSSGGSATVVQGDWSAVVTAAEQEGSVTYYTNTAPDQNTPLIDAFTKKYPDIRVNFVRGANELEAKLDAEIASNIDGADVVDMTHREWNLRHAGDFMPLKGIVPAVDSWPADAWSVPDVAPEASVAPMGIIAWNTNIFPNGFANWDDLLAPDVKQKVGFRDPVDAAVAGYMSFLEEANGPGFLPAFAAQEPRFYPSVVPMAQAVASGEIGVAAMSIPATLVSLKAQGAPIDWVIPPKTWAQAAPVMILKKAQRPNAARVFVEFLLSPEGQAAFNGKQFGSSVLPNIPDTLDLSGHEVTLIDPNITSPEVVTEWAARHRELFKRG
jgi:iron(III) transport system substrate-binding protein